MGLSKFFSAQARKPSGWFGRLIMPLIFDLGNAKLNGLMKDHIDLQANDRILEIGCGTGKLVRELAGKIGDGLIEGVEFSETMFSIARRRNQAAITDGRVILHTGDFNELALKDDAYDIVCSCNAIYFWPDPPFTLNKAHSVLKPGGRLILAFEDKARMEKKAISSEIFKYYSLRISLGLSINPNLKERCKSHRAPEDHPAYVVLPPQSERSAQI